ncbi:MAG TPA: hypothetical protein VMU16_04010 [Candidatus Binataceae bacterium]|nr:hypothetical protein [Candidatus Binataceae bacterium]
MKRYLRCAFAIAVALAAMAARPIASDRMSRVPHVVLWAWERRENLGFIDPATTGVAYLAVTLELSGDRVVLHPRLQPLTVPPRTTLVPVARIETDWHSRPTLSDLQRAEAARIIAGLANPSAAAIQIDFDASKSQRGFYRELLADVRGRIPASIPLSMTALASWCLDDNWIAGLPVDETVPMLFRMGRDSGRIDSYLRAGGKFSPAIGQTSIGLALDEPFAGLSGDKRVYLFSPRPWTAADANAAIVELAR